MNAATTGWRTYAVDIYSLSLIFAFLLFIRNVYKAFHAGEYHEAAPILQQLLVVVLVLVGVAGQNLNGLPMWFYVITPTCVHYALLICYFVHYQVFNNKLIPILSSKQFFITTILSIISVIFGIYAGNISISYINNEAFNPSLFYYIHYALTSLISGYLEILTAIFIANNLHQHKDLSQRFRRYADLCLFLSFILASGAVEVSLLANIIFDGRYRHQIDNLFYVGIGLAGFFVPLVLFPQDLLIKIIQPLSNRISAQEAAAQQYLYDRMTQVVTCVKYRPTVHQPQRMLIELEQAHYILWTHEPRVKPIKPYETAAHLLKCLQDHIEYTKVGPCIPPPTYYEMDDHLRIVANQLRKLEDQWITAQQPIRHIPKQR